ncbi:hypothetical protein FQA39_LY11420 [Lamprigera yunnana]|nr:hypothetical protein FQA39_LY11420 [Lamprigera yunnana]
MSYRPRRGRSRTPTRFRAEGVPLHPERSREDAKRDRWEMERPRPRVRSRSPRRLPVRSSSREKRPRYEPPELVPPTKRSRSNERKYISGPTSRSWNREDERALKFSPPIKFSPIRFQEYNRDTASFIPPNEHWNPDLVHNPEEVAHNYPPVNYTSPVANNYLENQNISGDNLGVQEPNNPNLLQIDPKGDGNESTIPDFNPESSKLSATEWIKLIETIAIERDWKPDEKLYVLTSRLAGYARQWYLNTGLKCKNWIDLKQSFVSAFPSENDYYYLLSKMVSKKKEERESLTTYFHHKVALLNACDIYGRKAVSCIVGGLPNGTLKDNCKWQNFDDPDLLYQYLRSYSENPNEPPKKIAVEKRPKSTPKKATTNQICYYCKKKGHLVVNCELKFKQRGSQPFAELPPKEESRSNPNSGPQRGSLSQKPLYNKYFTDVAINGIPIKGYVDQASECTTIREETAHFLKLPYNKLYKTVKGFGGHSVSVIGVVETSICVDRAMGNVKLYIVSDLAQVIPIIVGQSFTEQSHVVVMKDGDKVRYYQRMDNGQTNFDF